MFTAAEYRLIREHCPEKLDALLENLNIPKPDWESDDEISRFSSYEELDDKIIQTLCEKMKSGTIIDGYTELMKLGNLPFDYSETDNELLSKLVQNKNVLESLLMKKIMAAKTAPAKPASAPKYDYSQTKVVLLKNRKMLSTHVDFTNKLRNFICKYFEKLEPYNVLEAIEISIKTKNGVYEPARVESAPKITPPPFSQQELSSVLESLQLVEEIIKSMEGR